MPRIRSRAGVCGGPFRPFGFRSIRPGRSIRPELEALEDRLLPATAIWSGASLVNSNWSTPQNWQANIAPSSGADLVFPAGAAQQSSVDDFPSGTTFHSITFSAGASPASLTTARIPNPT